MNSYPGMAGMCDEYIVIFQRPQQWKMDKSPIFGFSTIYLSVIHALSLVRLSKRSESSVSLLYYISYSKIVYIKDKSLEKLLAEMAVH